MASAMSISVTTIMASGHQWINEKNLAKSEISIISNNRVSRKQHMAA